MSDAGKAEPSETARPPELGFVFAGGTTNFHYDVGALLVGEEPAKKSVAVAIITNREDRVVVALPHKAWDRKVKNRRLSGPFVRSSARRSFGCSFG